MKKLFLLIPALVLSMMMSAKVTNITPTSPYESDAVRKALYYSAEGDTIVLAEGVYVESNSDYITWKRSNVVMAAESANVVIKPHVSFRVKSGARAELIGVKIDASELTSLGSYEDIFQAGDASDGNRLILENCKVYGNVSKTMVRCASDKKLDSLIINNCYIHDNAQATLRLQSTSLKGVIITNTTIANVANGGSFWCAPMDISSTASDAKVIVDHCTFYHNTSISSSYADVTVGYDGSATGDVTITNCIFAQPASYDGSRAINLVNGGTVRNCLTFNYTKSTNGIQGATVKENCIAADPLFTDAANADYSFPGNWATGSVSPAREAATDGSDLGDPRWYSAEVLPSTAFAPSYVFLGAKAKLSGSFALNGDSYIQSDGTTTDGLAVWKIQATRKCMVEVTLNIASANTSGHRYEVALYDANNALVGTALAEPSNSWSHGDKVLGIYEIPAAGKYTLKLTNDCDYSSTILEGVTLAYTGGAVQNIATDVNTTLPIAEAWFSGCTRDNDYIKYPSSGTADAWIKWNISTSETKYYDLTVNINTTYAHGFTIAIYEDEDAEPITSVTEGTYVDTKGELALELGRINLAGEKNYVVKVTNNPSGSQAKVANVVFAPVVATATALPNTLAFNNAVLSEKAFIQDGMLYFNEIGDTNPQGQWAQWEVTTDHAGKFLFTLNATSTNGQKYKITILDSGNNELDSYEENCESGDKTLKHFFVLAAGTYYVKVENTRSYSKGHLTSLVVTEPEVITLDEAATSFTYQTGVKHYQLIRTLKAGMYNTFCSPLKLTSDVCKAVFGADVEIYTLKEAIADGAVLNVELKSESDIWQGTPVFIRPSHDIVNPIFIEVEMMAENPASTTKTNANFVGTFVKTTLGAGENILYLGPDNTLYYPEVDTPIKGMRGWFAIHDTSTPSNMIKRMRIVENTNVVTDVELVGAKNNAIKTIENGQLVITIDGVRYNVMGVKIQ